MYQVSLCPETGEVFWFLFYIMQGSLEGWEAMEEGIVEVMEAMVMGIGHLEVWEGYMVEAMDTMGMWTLSLFDKQR